MYSSPRDMALFLAANLGDPRSSGRCARRWRWHTAASCVSARTTGRRWPGRSSPGSAPTIVEKYGGLNNASAYIGMVPDRKLGIVILGNRGNQYPNEVGRRILLEFAAP